jgi:hypothetical protein
MSYPSFNEEALGQRTWVIRLTGLRKGRRDHSIPEKRGQARSANRTSRKTRAAGSGLDCSKSNPDRGKRPPLTMGRNPQADSVRPSCAGSSDLGSGKSARWDTGRDIPGVGMNGRPKPRSDVRPRRNARLPPGREPQGNGAPVVVRERESRLQWRRGAGGPMARAWRYATCEMLRRRSPSSGGRSQPGNRL